MSDRASEIRARQQARRKAVAAWSDDYIGGPDAVEDVDTLLSILDAQPQGGPRGDGDDHAVRNFRWVYQLLLALAKRRLAEANANREHENDWPAGQQWHEMAGSSHSIFLRRAREEAGIPEDAFIGVIRSLEYDVDDLYESAATPAPVNHCGCTDHDPEVCLEGEVDEGQRYCHCECHVPAIAPASSTRVAGEQWCQGMKDAAKEVCDACGNEERYGPARKIEGSTRWWHGDDNIPCEAGGIWHALANTATPAAQPSPSLADAIARVREMRDRYYTHYYAKGEAANEIVKTLESLTPSDVVLVSREDAAKVCDGLVTFDPDHEKYTPEDESVPCGWCDGLERAAERIRSLPAYGDRKDG